MLYKSKSKLQVPAVIGVFILFCCYSLVFADESFDVTWKQEKNYGIYTSPRISVLLIVKNLFKEQKQVKLTFWHINKNGKKKDLSEQTMTLKAGEQKEFKQVDILSSFGLYTLYAKLRTGDFIRTFQTNFAYLPERDKNSSDVRFGTTAHFWFDRVPYPDGYEASQAIGLGTIRYEMRWQKIEQKEGVYHIPSRFKEYGFNANQYIKEPMLILLYGNPLYGGDKVSGRPMKTDRQVLAYVKWARWMAAQLRGKTNDFEIWNEPDVWGWEQAVPNKPTPKGDPVLYARMLNLAYDNIKAVNPNARIIAMATHGSNINFIEKVMDAGGLKFDAVSMHPYRADPENTKFREEMRNAESVIQKKLGHKVPLWLTEIGWSQSKNRTPSALAAEYLVRSFVLAMDSGVVEKYFWYDLKDDGTNDLEKEHNFGMFDYQLKPKAPAVACYMLTRAVAGLPYDRMLFEKNGVFVARFGKKNEPGTLVMWSAKKTGIISFKLSIELPIELSDITGGIELLTTLKSPLTIKVSGSPCFLRGVPDNISNIAVIKQQLLIHTNRGL